MLFFKYCCETPFLLLKQLQALVGSLEQKIGDTEKRYEETNKLSEERLKQALDAETKIIQLKTAMQRFEPINLVVSLCKAS